MARRPGPGGPPGQVPRAWEEGRGHDPLRGHYSGEPIIKRAALECGYIPGFRKVVEFLKGHGAADSGEAFKQAWAFVMEAQELDAETGPIVEIFSDRVELSFPVPRRWAEGAPGEGNRLWEIPGETCPFEGGSGSPRLDVPEGRVVAILFAELF